MSFFPLLPSTSLFALAPAGTSYPTLSFALELVQVPVVVLHLPHRFVALPHGVFRSPAGGECRALSHSARIKPRQFEHRSRAVMHSVFGHWRCFCESVLMACTFSQAWGTSDDEPQELEQWSANWWKQWLGNMFYLFGNGCIEACYISVLKMWVDALELASGQSGLLLKRLLTTTIALYFCWNFVLGILYFFKPFNTVLVCAAFGASTVRIIVVIVYLYVWCRIKSALDLMARSPSLYELLVTFPMDSREAGPWSADSTTARARSMLARMTRVSFGFTILALLKLCVLMYEIASIFSSSMSAVSNVWWILIFLDYLSTELVSAVLVLWLIRGRSASAVPAYSKLPGELSGTPSARRRGGSAAVPLQAAAEEV